MTRAALDCRRSEEQEEVGVRQVGTQQNQRSGPLLSELRGWASAVFAEHAEDPTKRGNSIFSNLLVKQRYPQLTDNSAVDLPTVNGTQTPTPMAVSRMNTIKAACKRVS